MAKNQQQKDHSLSYIIFFIIVIVLIIWAVQAYAPFFLLPWKYLRAIELGLTLQFDVLSKMWDFDFTNYGKPFDYVNERVGFAFRIIALCLMLHALYFLKLSMKPAWSMEAYLDGVFNRFKWLSVVYKKANGIVFSKKFPFVSFDFKHEYIDVGFPIGIEPLDFLAKFEETLPEKLKGQVGPALTVKDKKIVWSDPYAKELAYACYMRIPDKRPSPEEKSWREQAWQRCVTTHRFERTFALGMMQSARDFGVMNATEMLHIRREAGVELKKGNEGTFNLWRAMISLGGRSVYAEGAGVICHYHFERALTDYLVTHPDDKQIAHFMRGKPWVINAMNSFREVRNTVMNSPDVVALRNAGMLRR